MSLNLLHPRDEQLRNTPPRGRISIHITCRKTYDEELFIDDAMVGKVIVKVEDSGAGLSEEDQERIFRRFDENKLEGGGNKISLSLLSPSCANCLFCAEGSALGLLIAKRIIEKHQVW